MNRGFPVGCPWCGTQFALPAPPMPGQTFACQRCGQPFQPQAMMPTMPGFAPPRRKKTNWVLPAVLGGSAVDVLLLVGLIALLWPRDRPEGVADAGSGAADTQTAVGAAAPGGTATPGGASTATSALPAIPAAGGGTTPDAAQLAAAATEVADGIATEFKTQMDALKATLGTIRDPASRDAAIPRLVETSAALEQLVLRGARLAPLSETEYKAFRARHRVEEADPERAGGSGPRIDSKLANDPLALVTLKVQRRATAVHGMLNEGLQPLPPPRNAAEQVEHDAIVVCRSATRALAGIGAPADIAPVVAELGAATSRINELVAAKQALPHESLALQAKTTYLRFSVQPETLLTDLHTIIVERHGDDPALAQGLIDFSTARSNLSFARAGQASVAGGPPGSPVGQPRFPPASGGELPLGVQVFIQQFGMGNVVVVHCGELTEARGKELAGRIAALEPGTMLNHRENDDTFIAVTFAGDVAEFAGRIDFAKVISVNAAQRIIEVRP
jgi:hypothetical protein